MSQSVRDAGKLSDLHAWSLALVGELTSLQISFIQYSILVLIFENTAHVISRHNFCDGASRHFAITV